MFGVYFVFKKNKEPGDLCFLQNDLLKKNFFFNSQTTFCETKTM